MNVEDNETLTRTGPGTPMGRLMRHYWVPACKADELQRDDAPMRLLLLGEKLVAFRDSDGKVGIMPEACPHRGASLFYGRNEKGGLRCVYHGWKFDASGRCMEMPNCLPHQQFAERVTAQAYRTTERAGVVWVYMGDRAEPPPLPGIEATTLPEGDVRVVCIQRECNWLQNMEGDLDTSHFGFLHVGSVKPEQVDTSDPHSISVTNKTPEYYVSETEWGTMYAAYRPASESEFYYRFAHFVFPFWSMYPDGTFENHIVAQAWVPMDDTHTMNFNFIYRKSELPMRKDPAGNYYPGLEPATEFHPNTTDWYGRWRRVACSSNDYLIDRELQKSRSFTGIRSVPVQDQAIIESMGAVVDRSRENLAVSDRMVVRTRRRLLLAARALAQEGLEPPAIDSTEFGRIVRSGAFVADKNLGWMDAYHQALQRSNSPHGLLKKISN